MGIQVRKILSQIKSLIQKGNIKFGYNKMRKDELLKNYPSIQKVKKEFRWSSKISINKGLKKPLSFMKKNKKPLVSIIMNCFNGEKFLKKSLRSVLNQSYKNWELIFFDNISTDRSIKIVKNFNDKRIKIFQSKKKHLKLYHARNEAIKHSKGKFIAFIDCDDWWKNNKLKKQINLFKKDKSIDIVYTNLFIFNNSKKKSTIFSNDQLKSGLIVEELLKSYKIFILTVLAKRKIFQEKMFNKKYDIIGDFEFFIRKSFKYNW